MKRGDEKALKRAASKLNISPDEKLLEFDIGDFLYLLLPDDFPKPLPPRAKRIDLVASDKALYVHSFGIHRRYAWSEILECTSENAFFSWRTRTGPKCQIHIVHGSRPLAEVVNRCIQEYERQLDSLDRERREQQRFSYDAQDRQRAARREVLQKQNEYYRALAFTATVTNSGGKELRSSTAALTTTGVGFTFDAIRRELLVPFEYIEHSEIDLLANSVTAQILNSDYKSFTVQGMSSNDISLWKQDLDLLMAVELT